MSPARRATVGVMILRLAWAVAALANPPTVARRWLGKTSEQPGGRVAIRALGARELALHTGALLATVRGAPVRPWLLASIAGDFTDVAATIAERDGVPRRSPLLTALAAGGAAAVTAGLLGAVDE